MRAGVAAICLVGWASVAAANPSLPVADGSLREVRTCAIVGVVFSDALRGRLVDQCGAVFLTEDGGKTWRRIAARGLQTDESRSLAELVWLSPTVAVALLDRSIAAYRTEDGGETWVPVRIPDGLSELPTAIESVGQHVWSCTGHGQIFRSDDAGRTWRILGTPFDSDRGCRSLSFLDENTGWAGGMEGDLYETTDGATTWVAKPRSWGKEQLFVYRRSREVGWVSAGKKLYLTSDGGADFSVQPIDDTDARHLYLVHDSPRTLFSSRRGSKDHELRPRLDRRVAPMGERDAVSWDGDSLTFFRDGELVRTTTIVKRMGPPKPERLVGTYNDDEEDRVGWSRQHVFRSQDRGRTWSVIGDLPPGSGPVTFLDSERAFTRARAGRMLSEDGGRTWHREPVTSQLACTATASSGVVQLAFEHHGPTKSIADRLRLEWNGGSARLTGALPAKDVKRTITLVEARAILAQIAEAAATQERPPDCMTEWHDSVELTWSCNGKARKKVSLQTVDCVGAPSPAANLNAVAVEVLRDERVY